MRSLNGRPLVAFISPAEITHLLFGEPKIHNIPACRPAFDFAIRKSVENVHTEDEKLFVIIYFDQTAPEEWTLFVEANKENPRFRYIKPIYQTVTDPNLLTTLFLSELEQLKKDFPILCS